MIENGHWPGASKVQESGLVTTLLAGIVEEKWMKLQNVLQRKQEEMHRITRVRSLEVVCSQEWRD